MTTADPTAPRRTRNRGRAPEPRTPITLVEQPGSPSSIDSASVHRNTDGTVVVTLGAGAVSSASRLSPGLARALSLKLERITRS